MNYEILSLETVKKLKEYKKLQTKYKKLKIAYEELIKELRKRDKDESKGNGRKIH